MTTAATAPSTQQQQIVQKIVTDLRSRHTDTRNRAAKELFSYVSTDLREVPPENLNAVLDYVTKHLLDTVKGDASALLGGILAVVALINALDVIDIGKTDTRISRFGNFLCNACLAPSTDPAVIELAAKALARLTQVSGTYTTNLKFQLITHEVKRAFEVLQLPGGAHGSAGGSSGSSGGGVGGSELHRGDTKRYAAVLVLREIACCMPTFFFQNVSQFFEVIFNAVWDPRPALRESAANAVRAALVVTTQREMTKQTRHQHLTWYKTCYDLTASGLMALEVLNDNTGRTFQQREDLVHGSLLVLAELLRCSHAEWERVNRELEENIINGGVDVVNTNGWSEAAPGSPEKTSKLSAVKRYYNAGLNRHARTGGNASQIPFNWFGSVAVGKEQIVESAQMRQLIVDRYDHICNVVLKIAHNTACSKNHHIQKALLLVLPKLAAFERDNFISHYLVPTVAYTDRLLQGKDHRYNAYLAVGLLAMATGAEMQAYLRNVLTSIRLALPSKEHPNKKRTPTLDPAIFACISMLARAVKDTIKHDMSSMLEAMLSVELSPSLTTALYELAAHIPAFKKDIAEGLLKILSKILMQQPFRHPGTPRQFFSPVLPSAANLGGGGPGDNNPPESAAVVLALRTLGAFDFEGHSLLQFVRHCADNYLHSEDKLVRLEAVKTCLSLLKGTLLGLSGRKSPTVMSTVNEVLAKLLVVGITDQDHDVRFSVMECLDECFDYHLAQAENLSALFVAMNDERFEIRELTMCIIGRLSILNPAYIMPSLRKTLMQLLTELEHSGVGRNKEHSAQLLGHLVANAPTLICPYVEPILTVLIPKLKEVDVNPMVVTSVLRAIGDLAHVGGKLMAKYVDELLPTLLEILGDASSSQKREVSLWTLAQLVASTGCVVTPYTRYPTLLDTLLGFLRTEQKGTIRSQTLRLLGLMGALDPYQHKMMMGQIDTASVQSAPLIPISDSTAEMEQSYEMSPSEMLVNVGTSGSLDDFYPSVAIAALMKIIRDPTLSRHHTEVVKAVTFIFNALGIKSVPYIAQVIPSMMNVIRTSEDAFRDFLFQQLGGLISKVRQHIRNYLNDIFDLIKDFWIVGSPLQPTIILLVENIAVALGSEFKIYLPQLIPQILRILMHDTSTDRHVTGKLLAALQKFGSTLNDYMHLFLPPIVRLFDSQEVPMGIRKGALECIDHLSDVLDFSEYASLIIHPLVRCLDSGIPELRLQAMDTLTALVIQLGKKYSIFIPMVHKVLIKQKINHQRYEIVCARVMQGGSPAEFDDALLRLPRRRKAEQAEFAAQANASATGASRKLQLPTEDLRKAWAVSRRISKDDWLEWYNGLCREFLKVSPSPALRACWTVAQRYTQLAKDLFNASFVSCWSELDATQQDELMSSLEQALTIPDLPEISQTILNLAEFMEHCDKGPLPLDPVLLGEQAVKCRAYAKALHYKEDEFHREATVPVVESLMSINNKLGQKEAATGLLEWGRKNLQGDLKAHERWYEKLHEWEKALDGYKEKLKDAPQNPELVLSKMRCLEALGEWGEVHNVSLEHWDTATSETQHKMARMASAAAWGRKDWKSMERYVSLLPRETQDGAFYRAIVAINREQWSQAQSLIELTRELLDTEVSALSLESYQRAYPAVVCVQMLAELEEVIEYKLVPERRPVIKEMWWQRLQGCQRVIEDWQRILQVRAMVLDPAHDDQRTWLKYASLCRKSGRLSLSHKTLVTILGSDPSNNPEAPLPVQYPQASFAYCKHLWMSNKQNEAFSQLQNFVRVTLQPRCALLAKEAERDDSFKKDETESRQLLARCYLKMGQWQENLHGVQEETIPSILSYYAASTEHDSNWYKAWHAWAVMNFETCLFYRQQQQQPAIAGQQPVQTAQQETKTALSPQTISNYAVPALKGFVRSISLSKGSSLQDTLRLLTLLFDYGHQSDMYEALHEGVKIIEVDNWLQVIPQLIARIDTPRPLVGRLIHQLLTDLGKHHPQALVYPLTVACKSSNAARRTAANKILNKIREHSETLVNQAVMVSDELIRTAILWHEQWHEGLEEASRLYFGERNIPGMLAKLEPLHAMLEKGPQTLKETSFHQAYGNDLNEAKKWCQRYRASLNIRDLNQAWDLYYHVFRRISRQLPQLTQLELQYVSPKLLICRDLELAVPGSYTPHAQLICISQVQPSLQVITSKQRPRKLCIRGSNGRTYMFLLKGHEDLRQDERVMQFFSLVNSLLISDPETFRRNLAIQRFAVIPLSTNSGLIGWVPHSDTLHGLIKDYREKKKILLNIEHRIMQRMTPDYDHLPLMNKVEVFEHALEHTQGDDLAKILLLKAPSSEVWFDRRTNFTRSLAVMSMVGYVLGLGDRHPSNLLLDRMSGKILHIDFGDCFEVAMTREKFPEKIPFRLTRMLIHAMEVTGIEGTYRCTCESVMTVLRNNKDSLMAVLEAFVYDPLLNWRLIETGPKGKKSKTVNAQGGASIAGGVVPNPEAMEGVSLSNVAPVEGGNPLELMLSQKKEMGDDVPDAPPSMGGTVPELGCANIGSLGAGGGQQPEALNKKALDIVQRVRDKLTGRDFNPKECLSVTEQVDLLICQATNNENLCQCYIGWCPFW